MPELTENPAIALREAVRARFPGAMVRWDASGRALLVCDAPRRDERAAYPAAIVDNGLLFIDLPDEAYAALSRAAFYAIGLWRDAWFEEQALLRTILSRPPLHGAEDRALLRAAMLACAQGAHHVRLFARRLRAADAQALRTGEGTSAHACAALLAHYLWTHEGVGLPAGPESGIL